MILPVHFSVVGSKKLTGFVRGLTFQDEGNWLHLHKSVKYADYVIH